MLNNILNMINNRILVQDSSIEDLLAVFKGLGYKVIYTNDNTIYGTYQKDNNLSQVILSLDKDIIDVHIHYNGFNKTTMFEVFEDMNKKNLRAVLNIIKAEVC